MISTQVVRTREEFPRLQTAWKDLLSRSLSDNPFLSWEWISTWVEVYSKEDNLFVMVVTDGDTPVAIAPLWLDRRRIFGLPSVRVLRFLGAGEVCSDYLDIIVAEHDRSRWITEIWNHLFGTHGREWDVFEYSDTLAGSRVQDTFQFRSEQDPRCLARVLKGSTACPFLPLPDSPEAFTKSLSPSRRWLLNTSEKKLTVEGKITTTMCGSGEQLASELALLQDLNTRSWQERGHTGSFRTPDFIRFNALVAKRFLQANQLFLCSIWHDELYLGSFYGYQYKGTLYMYIFTVRRSALKRVSIGSLLLARCIEKGIALGCKELDFLRGIEDYKYRWTSTDRRLISLQYYNRSVRALAYYLYGCAARAVRITAKFLLRSIKAGVTVQGSAQSEGIGVPSVAYGGTRGGSAQGTSDPGE